MNTRSLTRQFTSLVPTVDQRILVKWLVSDETSPHKEYKDFWWPAEVKKVTLIIGEDYLGECTILYDAYGSFHETMDVVQFQTGFIVRNPRDHNERLEWKYELPTLSDDMEWTPSRDTQGPHTPSQLAHYEALRADTISNLFDQVSSMRQRIEGLESLNHTHTLQIERLLDTAADHRLQLRSRARADGITHGLAQLLHLCRSKLGAACLKLQARPPKTERVLVPQASQSLQLSNSQDQTGTHLASEDLTSGSSVPQEQSAFKYEAASISHGNPAASSAPEDKRASTDGVVQGKPAASSAPKGKATSPDGVVEGRDETIGKITRRSTSVEVDCAFDLFEALATKVHRLYVADPNKSSHDVEFYPSYHAIQDHSSRADNFIVYVPSLLHIAEAIGLTKDTDLKLLMLKFIKKPKPGDLRNKPFIASDVTSVRVSGTYVYSRTDVHTPAFMVIAGSYPRVSTPVPADDSIPAIGDDRSILAFARESRYYDTVSGAYDSDLKAKAIPPSDPALYHRDNGKPSRLERFYFAWRPLPANSGDFSNDMSKGGSVPGKLVINCPYLQIAGIQACNEFMNVWTSDPTSNMGYLRSQM